MEHYIAALYAIVTKGLNTKFIAVFPTFGARLELGNCLCPITGLNCCTNREKRSFDNLIGEHHKCLRNGQPERLRRLEIYNEIEFDRLLDRNVRRFRSA